MPRRTETMSKVIRCNKEIASEPVGCTLNVNVGICIQNLVRKFMGRSEAPALQTMMPVITLMPLHFIVPTT